VSAGLPMITWPFAAEQFTDEKLRIDVVMCNQDAFLPVCHLYQRYDASDYVSRKKQSSYFLFRFQPGPVTASFSAGKIKNQLLY
jgi:hypothetical protein